jgi:mono/diheme cytochrome c family protein
MTTASEDTQYMIRLEQKWISGPAGSTRYINRSLRNLMKYAAKIAMMTVLLTSVPAFAADVKANWDKHCAKCHGADGKGQTKMGRQAGAKDYTDSKVQAVLDDAKAVVSIKEGQKVNGKEAMKPFGDKLADDEIKALIAQIRSFKK